MSEADKKFCSPAVDGEAAATAQDAFRKACEIGDKLLVKILTAEAKPPCRASTDAAGADFFACEGTLVPQGGKAVVQTGIAIAIPYGTYARIAPRSGLAAKMHIGVGTGVVDYDYRGEVGVVLFNHSASEYQVNPGDRIAQLILEKIDHVPIEVIKEFPQTSRGVNGFGSTGEAAMSAGLPHHVMENRIYSARGRWISDVLGQQGERDDPMEDSIYAVPAMMQDAGEHWNACTKLYDMKIDTMNLISG